MSEQKPTLADILSLCDHTLLRTDCTSAEIRTLCDQGIKYHMTTAAKAFEAADAVRNGADEVDMVINLSMVKDGCWDAVADDIKAVREATQGVILKVIIECCLLTEEEKIKMCQIVSDSGADFIKTSTGFSTGGATFADVELMRANCLPSVQVKAAGGISSIEDAEKFIALGATRLGTSRIVKIAMAMEKETQS